LSISAIIFKDAKVGVRVASVLIFVKRITVFLKEKKYYCTCNPINSSEYRKTFT